MGKAIRITATTNLDSIEAPVRRELTAAFNALKALEPSPARLYAAATRVGKLRARGISVRGVVALLSVAGGGVLPTGKGTIERLGYVADGLGGKWGESITGEDAYVRVPVPGKTDDKGNPLHVTTPVAEAVAAVLYRIAQIGTAADVKGAAERGRKVSYSGDAQAAYDAVAAVRDALNAAEHKTLTTGPARKPGGKTLNPGADSDGESADSDASESKSSKSSQASGAAQGVALMGISTGRLITELSRRTSADWTPEMLEALTGLVAQVEAFIAEAAEQSADQSQAGEADSTPASPARKRGGKRQPVSA